jgi:hypothetical protein
MVWALAMSGRNKRSKDVWNNLARTWRRELALDVAMEIYSSSLGQTRERTGSWTNREKDLILSKCCLQ